MVKEFRTSSGMVVFVGENARENDELLKGASQKDLWFHLESHASAHAILKVSDKPSRDDIYDAALLVKHFGKQKNAKQVKVMYIEAKFVSKKGSEKEGQVIVKKTANSITVHTDEEAIERLMATYVK